MAFITEFSLPYYNKNIFKDETIETLPGVIAHCESEVVRTKAEFDKGNFGSYDGWADAKTYWHQALERRSIAKATYRSLIEKAIGNMQRIVKMEPQHADLLSPHIESFKAKLLAL